MKYLGKMFIGNNQSGKGDDYRPKAKHFNTTLFFTPEQVEKFKVEVGPQTHCFICKQRIYASKTFSVVGKILTVGDCCKDKVYL